MKCPHCQQEIPGASCPECREQSPEGAAFCMHCGAAMDGEETPVSGDGNELDFEDRILCPDGRCTGIIVDGKCTECGRKYTPGAPQEEETGGEETGGEEPAGEGEGEPAGKEGPGGV